MAKQNKKNNKMTRPNSLPLLHPWGVQSFFLFFCFLVFLFFLLFGFLFSGSLLFFEGLAKQHESEGPRPNSLPVLPLQGFANLLVVVLLFALGLWFH